MMKDKFHNLKIRQTALLLVGAALLLLGIAWGEAGEVWRQAILICFSCIGLG
jgi:hypothetical protein